MHTGSCCYCTCFYSVSPSYACAVTQELTQDKCKLRAALEFRLYALLRTSTGYDTMAKRALIVGCNYPGSPHQLAGCANDANSMRSLLCEVFNYQVQNVVMMVDPDAQTTSPTGVNIKVVRDLTSLFLAVLVRFLQSHCSYMFRAFYGHVENAPVTSVTVRDCCRLSSTDWLLSLDLVIPCFSTTAVTGRRFPPMTRKRRTASTKQLSPPT